MARRSIAVLFLAFAIVSVLSACGSEDEPGGDTPATVTTQSIPAAQAVGSSGCWAADAIADPSQEGANVAQKQWSKPPEMTIDPEKSYTATLETSMGSFDVEFFPGDAPMTVNNFVCLAREGYYDGTPFHRIVQGFVVQGGDPTGTGAGGPGYRFNDEPVGRDYEKGMLAMANAGPNTNGSQFFVCVADLRGKLPKNYTIFGRVTDGMDVVDQLASVPTQVKPGSSEKSSPIEPVTLLRVTVNEA